MFVLWNAVIRIDSNGKVLGADQRISALEAITVNAAYQAFEEDQKGSIEIGKLADLVVLDANPLTVSPDAIKDISVSRRVKEGKAIYATTQLANPAAPYCVETGGQYEIRKASDGGAFGI
ncbi:MAG: putative amidohydrolase YtcJ [Paracoccaceae bacterium]|jgi:predicted amidohydrolase YtcJ